MPTLSWGWWMVIAALAVAAVVRALRWRDQPFHSAWLTPTGIGVAAAGVALGSSPLAVIGLAALVAGFAVDRFYLWRADETGRFRRDDVGRSTTFRDPR
ncbi:MAG: hypothetical protein U0R76_00595 [Candidatus Nanopelagicales bacterium]